MVFLLMPWIAIELTGSATSAGLMVTLTSIPGLLLSPVMGSFIDKFGRRKIGWLGDVGASTVNLSIAVVASTMGLTLQALIAIAILRTILGAGGPSARKSLVPDAAAAGRMTLERANSIHEAVAAAGFATGPAIAAICINLIGTFNSFYVVAAVGLMGALTTWLIRVVEQHEAHDDDEGRHFASYAVQGFKIVFQTPSVLIVMSSILMLAVLYLPTELVVLPAFYNAIGDPGSLGALISIMAISTTVGALLFERAARLMTFSTLLRVAVLGVALAMVPMSLLPPNWVMFSFGVVLGLAWGPLPVLLNTVIQRKIPANKRGRVFSLEMTIWTGGPMISMTFAGAAVDAFGVHIVYPVIAAIVMAGAIWVATRKSLVDLNTAEAAEPTAAPSQR